MHNLKYSKHTSLIVSVMVSKFNPRLRHFLGAALNLAGNIADAVSSNKNINKQIASQERENQKNREWNLNLAKMQNQWSIEQWNRENQYNSPSAQMARAKAAGLNPDLIYGDGGATMASASSPEMTAGAPSSPVDMSNLANKKTFGAAIAQSMQQYYSAKTAEANIELAESQANKNNVEAEGTSLENNWIDKLNGNTLDIGNATIRNLNVGSDLAEEQKKKIGVEIQQIHTNIDKLREEIAALGVQMGDVSFQQGMKRLEFALNKELTYAKISQIAHQNNLTVAQVNQIKETLPFLIGQMAAQNEDATASAMLKQSQRHESILRQQGIVVQNGILSFNADILGRESRRSKKYEDSLESIGIIGSTISVATQLIQDVLGGTIGSLIKRQ